MRAQLPLALLLASAAVACVDESAPTTTDEIASALELENGGLDTTDEAPMFDAESQYTAAALETDADVVDPMATDPVLVDMQRLAGADVREVAVMWGRFPLDLSATAGRDWSGELRVSRGGIVLRRRIGFEAVTDRVLPRTSRDVIEFDSTTRPFADGLVLEIIDPTPGAGPLGLRYTGDDGTVYDLDISHPNAIDAGDGNRVVVSSHRRDDACAHGFLRGRWHALRPNVNGYLGVVANARGQVIGHIRGIAGERQSGEPVMFGKFIDRDGRFVGILRGTYADGAFEARWLDRAGDHGAIRGRYFAGPEERAGGFLGQWAETSCVAPTP